MGGGAIRAAAKVAGITAAAGGLRSVAAEHFSVSSAARKASAFRPVSATADDVKLVASNSETGVQRPFGEIDDWVFPIIEEEVGVDAAEPMPRVVFGGAPTLQEAKEATSELSVALEKAYLASPNLVGCGVSDAADQDPSLSLANKEVVETKACVASEISTAPAVPAPAIMAFRFLHESPVAKNVVASIACDPNVWNAVLQNPELQEFLQSQRACDSVADKNFSVESVVDYDPKSFDVSSEHSESAPVGGFMDIIHRIKSSVVDMMSSLSGYFQHFFGGNGANGVLLNSDGTARLSADTVMEASFMGLAVMAILVILLKRV